jgi:hypothetical protein
MSCLFNTLSKFIELNSNELRENICNYLQNNPILYEDMKAENAIVWSNEGYKNIEQYIEMMRSTSTWGGAIEIKAFCNMYHMKVIVNGRNGRERVEFLPAIKSSSNDIEIKWNGGHYYV